MRDTKAEFLKKLPWPCSPKRSPLTWSPPNWSKSPSVAPSVVPSFNPAPLIHCFCRSSFLLIRGSFPGPSLFTLEAFYHEDPGHGFSPTSCLRRSGPASHAPWKNVNTGSGSGVFKSHWSVVRPGGRHRQTRGRSGSLWIFE